MSQQPLFWYRPRSDGGYEGPLHNGQIEDIRKASGAWVPLFAGAAHVNAEPSDDEIIDIAVEPLGIDCDRMPYGVVVFARALLSRYSSAPVATQAQLGEDIIVNCPDNVYTLPLRSSGLTQGPRFVVHVPAQTSASAELECSHCGGTGDVSSEYPGVACPACGGTGKAAPVAAQPDLTQQTLDDVMAGIPARDAEIEALRKVIEALQAQQDTDKVDAERYQAWRDALITGKTAEDDFIRLVADNLPTSVGVSRRPTAAEWDAAIDAARKEQA